MTTIGIIGASGQVGTEVCLYLSTYPGIKVVGIVRTCISGAILRRCGIEIRVGTFATSDESARLVGDCDLIADFSLISSGDVSEIRAHYARYVVAALRDTPPHARYIFVSSINAFGMGDGFNRAKNYWIPRSVYAYTKRYGERLAHWLGRKHGKRIFVFRLGHVHGLLQRVSQETAQIAGGPYSEYVFPETPSYTIFCHSVAEAIVNVSAGKEHPGIYTLISEPPWSWDEILRYYAPPGRRLKITLRPSNAKPLIRNAPNYIRDTAFRFGNRYRDTLRANLLHRFPRVELKIQAEFYSRRARQQICEWQDQFIYRPPIHDGVFPGERLSSLSDSRITMQGKVVEVKRILSLVNFSEGALSLSHYPRSEDALSRREADCIETET